MTNRMKRGRRQERRKESKNNGDDDDSGGANDYYYIFVRHVFNVFYLHYYYKNNRNDGTALPLLLCHARINFICFKTHSTYTFQTMIEFGFGFAWALLHLATYNFNTRL